MKGKKHNAEAIFHKWFITREHKYFKNIESEVSLHSAYEMLSDEMNARSIFETRPVKRMRAVGRIDLVFTHKSKRYCCEIKYSRMGNTDFWDALKVMGYAAYYSWVMNRNYEPAIMCPAKALKLEHYLIANSLGIKLFGITKVRKDYVVGPAEYTLPPR